MLHHVAPWHILRLVSVHPNNTLNELGGDEWLYFTKSLLTTAYLWPFDMVVLLVLPISVAAWLVNNPLPRAATGLALMTYLAINLLAFARHGGHNYFESIWLVPLLSLWYVGIQWHQRRRRVQPVRATS